MNGYLLKLLVLFGMSSFIIYIYYFLAPGHQNSYSGYWGYFLIVGILYACYSFVLKFLAKDKLQPKVKLTSVFGIFLVQLFLLCCAFFYFNDIAINNGLQLFMRIIFYSIFPVTIFIACYSFGDTVLKRLSFHKDQSNIFQFLSGLGGGFLVFMSLLVILGFFGLYNIYTVGILVLLMLGVGWKSFINISKFFFTYTFEFHTDSKKPEILHFFSTEFLFFVLSLVISVNLISIVRPVPIGWDDLGVYMNYANMMAQAGDILSLGGMYTWQVFTGIGFMTGSSTQAFFFNSIGGMMFALTVFLLLKDVFGKSKHVLLNIPLLLTTVLISMPMVVFQLSKDMKLDPGLLFISSIALYIVYYVFTKIAEKEQKQRLLYLGLAGLIIGLSFSIKFTSLLFLSGILGLVSFASLGIAGFLGFLGVYISVFTKFGLWSYMNISYPNENALFVNLVFLISGILGGICVYYGAIQSGGKKYFKMFLSSMSIVLLGFILAISPWIFKNITETFPNISIGNLLSGNSSSLTLDYTKIYSEEEIQSVELIAKNRELSASGSIQNEDWGRYFGAEEGINNYLKFPLNLTTQRYQGGEFTDIGFIFLAFIPTILLFLPYRRKQYIYITLGVCFFGFLAFLFPPTAAIVTVLLSYITLPFGYLIILGLFLSWLVLLKIIDHEKKYINLFGYNLVFTLFYTFLWTISSYGVVWYGIVMYMSFLIMIGITIYHIAHYKKTDTEKDVQIKLLGSTVIFVIFSFSFFMSTIPQAMKNLKNSGYTQYKLGNISAEESLFGNQNGYLEAIYELNIDTDKLELFLDDTITSERIRNIIDGTDNIGIIQIVNTLKAIQNDTEVTDITIKGEAETSLENVYDKILNPEEIYVNKKNIYRIGTFLAYYINQNKSRLFVDSLLFNFNDYLYDASNDITLENIKTVGLEYLLVDLNAATIDNDERKNLTARYEKLLLLMADPKLELISTDSVCLRIARINILQTGASTEENEKFKFLAGVNYESFDPLGEIVLRNQKLSNCYNIINVLFQEDNEALLAGGYGFLIPFKNYVLSNIGNVNGTGDADRMKFISQIFSAGRFALFKITD